MELGELLKAAPNKSSWVAWLVSGKSDSARSTLDFLDGCFANVRHEKHSAFKKKLLKGSQDKIDSVIHELVAHELLVRLNLAPIYEPRIKGKEPDLSFKKLENVFVADVYLAGSPQRTVNELGDGMAEAWDTSRRGDSRAHKIRETLEEKASKYSKLNIPLVLFVFVADHWIKLWDIEKAVFGLTIDEIDLEASFPTSLNRDLIPVGGLLLPYEAESRPSFGNVSAVIACDWFDSLNRHDSGKRLHCSVLHNWLPDTPLPLEAFQGFHQVHWHQTNLSAYKPYHIGERNIVAKFMSNDEMLLKPYTAEAAW